MHLLNLQTCLASTLNTRVPTYRTTTDAKYFFSFIVKFSVNIYLLSLHLIKKCKFRCIQDIFKNIHKNVSPSLRHLEFIFLETNV